VGEEGEREERRAGERERKENILGDRILKEEDFLRLVVESIH
jgi:hypothetical protein